MRKYPRGFSKNELKKFGVILEDEERRICRCEKCGKGWQPQIRGKTV